MPRAMHRRAHSAIVNTQLLSPNPAIPGFSSEVPEYEPVEQEEEEPAEKPVKAQPDIDVDEALHDYRCPRCEARRSLAHRRLPWMVATTVLGLACLWLMLTRPASSSTDFKGSYEKGFHNELGAIKSNIRIHPVTFSGSPVFDENGNGSIPTRHGEISYVGTPSAAIDAAWEGLVGDRSFLLSEEEARDAWGPDYAQYYNTDRRGYLSGLSTLHGLSCLNLLRQALDPDYYPKWQAEGSVWHTDHCVEHLRQMLMCSGDATPIPSKWEGSIGQWYVQTDRTHTCRDFSALHDWVLKRAHGEVEGAVKPGDVPPPM